MTSPVHRVPGLMAAFALVLCAQNPLVVRSTMPPPACGGVMAVADFDGSGRADYLVLAGTGPAPALGVVHDPFVTAGTCTTTPMIGPTSSNFLSARPARLNADAHLDAIVLAGGQQNLILDAYGTGTGAFVFTGTGPYAIPATGVISIVAVADLDANGRDDVVVARQGINPSVIEIFLNLQSGWMLTSTMPLGGTVYNAGDVDGNGTADLVWTELFYPTATPVSRLRIARGTGSGAFVLDPTPINVGPIDVQVADVVDLDGDGFEDVVMHFNGNGSLEPMRIVYGAPQATPLTLTNAPTPFDILRVPALADFDDDGVLDIMVEVAMTATAFSRHPAMMRGLGARQFSTPIPFSTETLVPFTTIKLNLVDVDGDRDLDLLRTEAPWFSLLTGIVLLDNQTIYAPGCAGTGGLAPAMTVGIATPDNPAFAIGVEDALPNAGAVLGVSLARVPVSGCGIGLNLGLANLVLPSGSLGFAVTDPAGAASIALPIPAGLSGATFYAQWGVADPQGTLSFAGQSFALSDARTLYVF